MDAIDAYGSSDDDNDNDNEASSSSPPPAKKYKTSFTISEFDTAMRECPLHLLSFGSSEKTTRFQNTENLITWPSHHSSAAATVENDDNVAYSDSLTPLDVFHMDVLRNLEKQDSEKLNSQRKNTSVDVEGRERRREKLEQRLPPILSKKSLKKARRAAKDGKPISLPASCLANVFDSESRVESRNPLYMEIIRKDKLNIPDSHQFGSNLAMLWNDQLSKKSHSRSGDNSHINVENAYRAGTIMDCELKLVELNDQARLRQQQSTEEQSTT